MNAGRFASAVATLTIAAWTGLGAAQATPGQTGAGRGPEVQTPAPGTAEAKTGHAMPESFVHAIAVANMAEVQLGKLATERAASADVKAYGQMMVQDHSKAQDELKAIASRMKAEMPAQLDQKHRDLAAKLSTLSGDQFDREYLAAMVRGHEDVLATLKTRTGSTPQGRGQGNAGAQGATTAEGRGIGVSEQALDQWASKTQPVVQQHLERARELQKKLAR
jgi:putative membrane protein